MVKKCHIIKIKVNCSKLDNIFLVIIMFQTYSVTNKRFSLHFYTISFKKISKSFNLRIFLNPRSRVFLKYEFLLKYIYL